jgi:hypothetical protein
MIPNYLPNFFLEFETQYFTFKYVEQFKGTRLITSIIEFLIISYHKYYTDDHIIKVKQIIEKTPLTGTVINFVFLLVFHSKEPRFSVDGERTAYKTK